MNHGLIITVLRRVDELGRSKGLLNNPLRQKEPTQCKLILGRRRDVGTLDVNTILVLVLILLRRRLLQVIKDKVDR